MHSHPHLALFGHITSNLEGDVGWFASERVDLSHTQQLHPGLCINVANATCHGGKQRGVVKRKVRIGGRTRGSEATFVLPIANVTSTSINDTSYGKQMFKGKKTIITIVMCLNPQRCKKFILTTVGRGSHEDYDLEATAFTDPMTNFTNLFYKLPSGID